MEDRYLQQLKKGVLEMLVLRLICRKPAYGYELLKVPFTLEQVTEMNRLKTGSDGLFTLKEGTLYPILYRLEDDGMIQSSWTTGEGRSAPKKVYSATEQGKERCLRQAEIWKQFVAAVDGFEEEQI